MGKSTNSNFLESDCHLICHSCNCFHTWGRGIADDIKEKYPEAYKVDLATRYGCKLKYGSFSYAYVNDFKKLPQIVVNLYSTYYFGKQSEIDYCIFEESLDELFYWVDSSKLKGVGKGEMIKIGFPSYFGIGSIGWKKENMLDVFKRAESLYSDKLFIEFYN